MPEIILVDENDTEIGAGGKMAVHESGQLHRAFSIFIFNSKNQLMLQQRAKSKYHSGGLWTNTCCSHPQVGEETMLAAHRRLKEEMGFNTELEEKFSFIYKAKLGNLIEHEFDHVFFGDYENEPLPDPLEVADWKWVDLPGLKADIKKNPDQYTYWFKIAIAECEKRQLI